jgi:hypothetical protein
MREVTLIQVRARYQEAQRKWQLCKTEFSQRENLIQAITAERERVASDILERSINSLASVRASV